MASAPAACADAEEPGAEGLRRLHGDEPAAVDGRAADLAQRVDDGHARDGGIGPGGDGGEHAVPHLRHGHGAGGVVDHHHLHVVRHGGQAAAHRVRPRGPAGHDRR